MQRTDDIELRLFLEALFQRYHYDFRGYSMASVKRRMKQARDHFKCETFSQLQDKLLHQPDLLPDMLGFLTVQVSEMFRDPSYFRAIREKDYVLAARSLGYGHARIVFQEILPNALPPIIVTSSVMVAGAILMEAALSFMGLGDPNRVSWGSMIGSGRDVIRTAWYLTALPGLAIVFTVISLNLISDGLNDALNPRFSEERR